MNTSKDIWKHLILRVFVIAGVGILVGYIFYRDNVFTPTIRAFQFLGSSITAALVYAVLKSYSSRYLWPVLFVWYVILTGLIVEFNWWLPILNLAYIGGITAAIYAYNYITTRLFVNSAALRIVSSGTIISIVNGLIIIVLSLEGTLTCFH